MCPDGSRRNGHTCRRFSPHPDPTAIELRNETDDAASISPSPPFGGRRGLGRGGPSLLGSPSPRSSPRSFLTGRGRGPDVRRFLNSTAVSPGCGAASSSACRGGDSLSAAPRPREYGDRLSPPRSRTPSGRSLMQPWLGWSCAPCGLPCTGAACTSSQCHEQRWHESASGRSIVSVLTC